MIRFIVRDVLVALLVLTPLFYVDALIVTAAMDWLHAHGLGAHTPDSGPLHDEYVELASGISAILLLFVGLFTIAPVVWWCDRRKVHMWNPTRPWNNKGTTA